MDGVKVVHKMLSEGKIMPDILFKVKFILFKVQPPHIPVSVCGHVRVRQVHRGKISSTLKIPLRLDTTSCWKLVIPYFIQIVKHIQEEKKKMSKRLLSASLPNGPHPSHIKFTWRQYFLFYVYEEGGRRGWDLIRGRYPSLSLFSDQAE